MSVSFHVSPGCFFAVRKLASRPPLLRRKAGAPRRRSCRKGAKDGARERRVLSAQYSSTSRRLLEYSPQSTIRHAACSRPPGGLRDAAISAFLRHGLNLPFWSFPGRWSAVRCRCRLSLRSCSVPLSRPSRPA